MPRVDKHIESGQEDIKEVHHSVTDDGEEFEEDGTDGSGS